MNKLKRPLAIIVLAAGQGTRMKSDLHKVLHPVAGRPMLLHLLDSVAALEPERIVVVAGARREQIESTVASMQNVVVAFQENQLGTGHAVLMARDALAGFDGDVLILYGDVPLVRATTMSVMLERLRQADAPSVVVLGFRPSDPGAYGRIVSDDHQTIVKMVEFKDANSEERLLTLCNSGLMAVRSRDLFDLLDRIGKIGRASCRERV